MRLCTWFFPCTMPFLFFGGSGVGSKRKERERDILKRRELTGKKTKKRSTGPSRVVPHRSTTPAQTCLTSLFGWEAVSQADMAALNSEQQEPSLIPPRH